MALSPRIRKLAEAALSPDCTRIPATALVEALAHKGVGIITLAQNNPGLSEDDLRGAFARTAELLTALEEELGTPQKSAAKTAAGKGCVGGMYKGFAVEKLEPFVDESVRGRVAQAVGFTDGCCQKNPGPGGIGAVLFAADGVTQLARISRGIGHATNNIAEYGAMIALLETARDLGVRCVTVFADSELMIKQMSGVYKVKQPHIMQLVIDANHLVRQFEWVRFAHVRRDANTLADALSTWCLDRQK